MEQLTQNCLNGDVNACNLLAQGDLYQIGFVLLIGGSLVWFGAHMVERFYIPWRTNK
jgi:hypothetical protein